MYSQVWINETLFQFKCRRNASQISVIGCCISSQLQLYSLFHFKKCESYIQLSSSEYIWYVIS